MVKLLIFLAGLALPSFAQTRKGDGWVSSSPQITELIFQLGLENHLVGTPLGSDYPEGAQKLKKVGAWFQPNLELILARAPQGVFWDESSFKVSLAEYLRKSGIESFQLSLNSVENLLQASREILKMFQRDLEPPLLDQSEKVWKKNTEKPKPFTFLALAWMEPPVLFGKDTFFFDVLSHLGGEGILPNRWNSQFLNVSEEWIMAQNPQKVVFLSHDDSAAQILHQKCLKWWPRKKEVCKAIPAKKFARASLTTLLRISELKSFLELGDE